MKITSSIFLSFILLVACSPKPDQSTNQDIPVIILNHEEPDLQVDFSPFESLGCNKLSGSHWYECRENSLAFKIGCTSLAENKLLGGLTPNYPIADCGYFFPEKEPLEGVDVPTTECFSATVMINGTSCSRQIIFKDDTYLLIKNFDDFKTLFAPVESPEEALAFALITGDYSAEYGQTKKDSYIYYVQKLEDTFIDKVIGGYIVHIFYTPVIGCGPFETESVELKVTYDGDVEEIDRYPVYRDPSQDTVCVD